MPALPQKPEMPGLIKGLGVTAKTAVRTLFPKRGAKSLLPAPSLGSNTVQYPHVIEHAGNLLVTYSRQKRAIEVIRVPLEAVAQLHRGELR